MLPSIWGKSAWTFFHLVTFCYPNNPTEHDKKTYYQFFILFGKVLPCDKCKFNFKKHLKKCPLDKALGSRGLLIKWGIDMHNLVNHSLGKKMLTYNEALTEIKKIAVDQSQRSYYLIWIVFGVFCILLVISYFYLKKID